MNGLTLSCFLHVCYTVYYYNKSKCLTIHNLISIWFSIIIVLGIITVHTGIYQTVHGSHLVFPYEPYVLEFVFFYIFMFPFRYLNSKHIEIQDVLLKDKYFRNFIVFLLICFLSYLIVCLKSSYAVLQVNVVDAYNALHFEGETYYKYNGIEEGINKVCGTLFNCFSALVLIYSIYGLMSGKKKGFYFICILICIACRFFSGVSIGGRGSLFYNSVIFLFVFVPFWHSFPAKVKNVIKMTVPCILGLFLLYAIIMTIQRLEYQSEENAFTSVLRYLGEPYPHLGNKFWNHVNIHPMGMRLYPFVVEPSSIVKSSSSLAETHSIWEIITGVPVLNYKTLYGDFYLEFGVWIPFIIIIVYDLILFAFIKNGKVSFFAFPILYYYLEFAACAPLWFVKRDWIGVRNLLILIISYFFFRSIFNKKNYRNYSIKKY